MFSYLDYTKTLPDLIIAFFNTPHDADLHGIDDDRLVDLPNNTPQRLFNDYKSYNGKVPRHTKQRSCWLHKKPLVDF